MILIAHRGNVEGANPLEENKPHYAMLAMYAGYDAEVDLWWTPDGLFLGHDAPKYQIDYSFLVNPKLWIHCKNIEALTYLSFDDKLHLFFHKDDAVLTSKGFVWTAPGLLLWKKSIAVMPELAPEWDIRFAGGVCTDNVKQYK